ncbi:hypothetical protein P7C73_g925, partial [Tremellales sp. Uapishka_1]
MHPASPVRIPVSASDEIPRHHHVSASPPRLTDENLMRQQAQLRKGVSCEEVLADQRVKYSKRIYAYTKEMWEGCRTDIEQRSIGSSSSTSLESTDSAGEVGAVPAVH